MRAARWLALAFVASLPTPALAAPSKLSVAEDQKMIAVLDEEQRDEARRQSEIAKRRAEMEHRALVDRMTMFGAIGVAVAVIFVWDRRRQKRA